MAESVRQVIGPVSAYALAKAHGYTGTEEQWATEQAQAGENARAAREAAEQAGSALTAVNAAAQQAQDNMAAEGTAQVAEIARQGQSRLEAIASAGEYYAAQVNRAGGAVLDEVEARKTAVLSEIVKEGDTQAAQVASICERVEGSEQAAQESAQSAAASAASMAPAEQAREIAEQARANAETAREAAEQARENAEAQRAQTFAGFEGEIGSLKGDLDDVGNRFSKIINFYNPSTLVDGFYVDDNTGELKAYDNWSCFEANLSSGSYIFSVLDSTNEPSKRSVNVTLFFASYDSNGKYISGSHTDKTGIVKVPNGARKTLISSHSFNFTGSAYISEPMLSTQEYYTGNGSYRPYSIPVIKEEHIPKEIVRKTDLTNLIVSGYTSELLGKNSEIFDSEIDTTISTILKITNKPCVVFPIVADTHYDSDNDDNTRRTLDTFKNLKALTKQISFDGIIHLGDVLTYNRTYDTEDKVDASNQFILNLMKECSDDIYVVPGNHDGINGGVPQTQNYPTYGRINAKTVITMLRRKLYRNCTTGIPENVLFVESWVIDFVLFEILIRRNWIYDDGKVRKADH